jgi:hypothetical protein
MRMLNFLPSPSSRLPDALDPAGKYENAFAIPLYLLHAFVAFGVPSQAGRFVLRTRAKTHRLQLLGETEMWEKSRERECLPICVVLASRKRMRKRYELTVIVLWLVPWGEKFRSSIANCGRPVEFEVACGR